MKVRPQEVNAGFKWQGERDGALVPAARNKEEMGNLDAAQTGVERLERLLQVFSPDQGERHLHGHPHRLIATVVEHRHPVQRIVWREENTKAVRQTHFRRERIGIKALQLVFRVLIDALIGKKRVAKIILARRLALGVNDARLVSNYPNRFFKTEIFHRRRQMMGESTRFQFH